MTDYTEYKSLMWLGAQPNTLGLTLEESAYAHFPCILTRIQRALSPFIALWRVFITALKLTLAASSALSYIKGMDFRGESL